MIKKKKKKKKKNHLKFPSLFYFIAVLKARKRTLRIIWNFPHCNQSFPSWTYNANYSVCALYRENKGGWERALEYFHCPGDRFSNRNLHVCFVCCRVLTADRVIQTGHCHTHSQTYTPIHVRVGPIDCPDYLRSRSRSTDSVMAAHACREQHVGVSILSRRLYNRYY